MLSNCSGDGRLPQSPVKISTPGTLKSENNNMHCVDVFVLYVLILSDLVPKYKIKNLFTGGAFPPPRPPQ